MFRWHISTKSDFETIEETPYVLPNGHYKCCGYYLNHPGCYVGPEKYKNTPWKLVPNIKDIKTNVEKIWNEPPIPGTYHLYDPTEQIMTLKKKLTPKVVEMIQKGIIDPEEELGIEYFMLMKYGEIDWEEDLVAPSGPPNPPLGPSNPPPLGIPPLEELPGPKAPEVPPISEDELLKDFFRKNSNYVNQPIDPPYGNINMKSNKYSTLNYFKWENHSCWLDATLTCLFSIAGSEWEQQIRNARYYDGVTTAIMEDIIYLQSERSDEKQIAKSIRFFADHFKAKQVIGAYGSAVVTVENMILAFKLDDSIEISADVDNRNIFSFVSTIYENDTPTKPSHFVSYVRQPDNNWIRIDGHDEFTPIRFILASEIDKYKTGYVGDFKSSYTALDGNDVVEITRRFESPNFFLTRKTPRLLNLSKQDVLNHWKNVRNYLGMIQPVYLSEARQKERIGKNKIPLHNVELYDKEDPKAVIREITNGSFNYPDKYVKNNYETLITDRISIDNLKTLVSILTPFLKNPQLVKFAIIPEYEARVDKGKLVKSNVLTDFDPDQQMLPFFEVPNDIMGGKVYNI